MKKMLAVLCLIFLGGCTSNVSPYQIWKKDWTERSGRLGTRRDRALQVLQQERTKESDFITNLTDEQLLAYQALSDIFATGNPAAEQLARRRLAQCIDRDSYDKAVLIMHDKRQARLKMDKVFSLYENMRQERERVRRQREAIRQRHY